MERDVGVLRKESERRGVMLTLSFYKSDAQSFCRFAFNQLCRGKKSFVHRWQCNERGREREGDRGSSERASKEKWYVTRMAAARAPTAAAAVRCVKAAKNDNVIQVGLLNLIGRG